MVYLYTFWLLITSDLGCLHGIDVHFNVVWKWWPHDSWTVAILLSMSSVSASYWQSCSKARPVFVILCSRFGSLGNHLAPMFWNCGWLCILLRGNTCKPPMALTALPIFTCLSAQIIASNWLTIATVTCSVISSNFGILCTDFSTQLWTTLIDKQFFLYEGSISLWLSLAEYPFTQKNCRTSCCSVTLHFCPLVQCHFYPLEI